MKSCPTCNRTYPDDNLAFCLMDGSILSAPYDPSESPQVPRRMSNPLPTEIISSPTRAAETRQPLQSTIRAPVPQVPDLHPPETTANRSDEPIVVSVIFRLTLATRGILAVLFIIPWAFVDHGGWPWNALYPPLAGALAIAAGVSLYAKFRTGRFLVVDGIVAVIVGIVILLSDRIWWYGHSTWPLVSGALLIAAAIELRKYFTRMWLLGLAGGIFTTYTILKTATFYGGRNPIVSVNFLIAMVYAEAAVAFAYGLILAVFSFLARGRKLSKSN